MRIRSYPKHLRDVFVWSTVGKLTKKFTLVKDCTKAVPYLQHVDDIVKEWTFRIDRGTKVNNRTFLNTMLFADDHKLQETCLNYNIKIFVQKTKTGKERFWENAPYELNLR